MMHGMPRRHTYLRAVLAVASVLVVLAVVASLVAADDRKIGTKATISGTTGRDTSYRIEVDAASAVRVCEHATIVFGRGRDRSEACQGADQKLGGEFDYDCKARVLIAYGWTAPNLRLVAHGGRGVQTQKSRAGQFTAHVVTAARADLPVTIKAVDRDGTVVKKTRFDVSAKDCVSVLGKGPHKYVTLSQPY
jgi:hypothetical protein